MNPYINSSTQVGSYANVQTFEEQTSMGKEAFLRLLVEQLKSQDPLQPLEDREFISQMTQFSNLEQLMNMNTMMATFINLQLGSALSSHSNLIGKTVDWAFEEEGQIVEGQDVVKGIILVEGSLWAELESGEKIPVEAIYRVVNGTDPIEEQPGEDGTEVDDEDQGNENDGTDEVGDDDENV